MKLSATSLEPLARMTSPSAAAGFCPLPGSLMSICQKKNNKRLHVEYLNDLWGMHSSHDFCG